MTGADFVQFCQQTYGRPGMKESCLALQDRHGVNVNCLLLAAWAAETGWALDEEGWRVVADSASAIRTGAVEPLRALRRRIWADGSLELELRAPLKRLLLYAEVRAEQAEERLLHREFSRRAHPAPQGERLLRHNLRHVCGAVPEIELEPFVLAWRGEELRDEGAGL